jgi:3-deoxy-D-manno-octulosonic acid (KDO) 8-phosphate synthase
MHCFRRRIGPKQKTNGNYFTTEQGVVFGLQMVLVDCFSNDIMVTILQPIVLNSENKVQQLQETGISDYEMASEEIERATNDIEKALTFIVNNESFQAKRTT